MTDGPRPEAGGAIRRVRLASERTELAWWRTGLAALAVAIGVGRVVPGLDDDLTRWPYVAVGVCFAFYGVALIAYGSARSRAVERVVEEGGFPEPSRGIRAALVVGGVVLGLLTALLIILD